MVSVAAARGPVPSCTARVSRARYGRADAPRAVHAGARMTEATAHMSAQPPGGAAAELAALFSPERRGDPYGAFSELRRTKPLWRPFPELLVASRHRDCAAVLRDPAFGHFRDDELRAPRRRRSGVLGSGLDDERPQVRSFLALNPPDHTRLRRLVARAFTPRRVEGLRPRVHAITSQLLDEMEASAGRDGLAPVDAVAGLAAPLPIAVISELLGVPPADRGQLARWSHALAKSLDPDFLVSDTDRLVQRAARDDFGAYLSQLVTERRKRPGSDLISELVAVRDAGNSLSESELIVTCTLLLIAGHETTTSLIGTGVLTLLRHPSELGALRGDPGLLPGAVEEVLRFDPPVQMTLRGALEDATIDETAVGRGTFVLLLIGAANRDPAAHDDPDRFSVRRTARAHLAFGQGVHFCLGAPLARLEAQVALGALMERFPRLALAGDPEWKDMAVLRGVSRLPVDVGRR